MKSREDAPVARGSTAPPLQIAQIAQLKHRRVCALRMQGMVLGYIMAVIGTPVDRVSQISRVGCAHSRLRAWAVRWQEIGSYCVERGKDKRGKHAAVARCLYSKQLFITTAEVVRKMRSRMKPRNETTSRQIAPSIYRV